MNLANSDQFYLKKKTQRFQESLLIENCEIHHKETTFEVPNMYNLVSKIKFQSGWRRLKIKS